VVGDPEKPAENYAALKKTMEKMTNLCFKRRGGRKEIQNM